MADENSPYITMMREYSQNTRTTIQIASAAMVLPITVIAAGTERQVKIEDFLAANVLLGICILSGVLFQVIAARNIAVNVGQMPPSPRWRDQPSPVYWLNIITFFLGMIVLVVQLHVFTRFGSSVNP